MQFPSKPAKSDEASMNQTMILSDGVKDLKNLSKQLLCAAEHFEFPYMEGNQKTVVLNMLKDYAIKAIVNTVDHLGSITYQLNDFVDVKFDEVSRAESRICCIEQRMRRCQDYVDLEGLSQQSLRINFPKYHKRYVLSVGEPLDGAIPAKSEIVRCSLDGAYQPRNDIEPTNQETSSSSLVMKTPSSSPSLKLPWQLRDLTFPGNPRKNDLVKSEEKPSNKLILLRAASLSNKPDSPRCSDLGTPSRNWPRLLGPDFGEQLLVCKPPKPSLMHIPMGKGNVKDGARNTSKGIRLLKGLLSRPKPKKDDMLYTYLDEY